MLTDILFSKARFVQIITRTTVPENSSSEYGGAIRSLHSAILGVCAIIDSNPHSIDPGTPSLIADVLAVHTYDPVSF